MVQLFPAMRLVPLKGIVKEFGQVIEQQLDFTLEADNNRIFRQNFAHCQQIVIPRLYDNLCGEAILTMEYLDGLIKVGHLDLTTQEREAAAITSLRALYQMIFIDGFTHGDMHPGNIFFRRNGEFVMLDLGLVARLSGSDLIDFASFFFGMVTNNGQECARVVYESATFRAPYCDRKKFETAMVELVDRHSSKGARDFEVSEFALQLFNTQRRHGICGSTNFMMTILSLVVFEGIAKQIHPNLDFQGEARRFIPAIMSRQRFGRY
jgi:ubiquinone biosynthesis protein